MNWAVFLDRDGVLIDAPIRDGAAGAAWLASDMTILPGVADAIASLRALGALLFVVTNQPDIARGKLDPQELDTMHDALRRALDVDDISTCPHDNADACDCRKPQPGMLRDLAQRYDVDLARSWMVGDRWVDIAAGAGAGARTILVDRPYSWQGTSSGGPDPDLAPDFRVKDLMGAAEIVRSHTEN